MPLSRTTTLIPGLFVLLLCAAASLGQTFQVDPVHSTGVFHIHHFNAGFVWGFIGQPSGTFDYDENDPAKIDFNISVSLDNLDTQNARRDADLKGPDWFDAKQFPNITFKSTAVKKTGDNTYDVTGDFTLHGVTKSIIVTMTMTGAGQGMRGETRVGFSTDFKISRKDYDMNTLPQAVGDEVPINVALEGIKQ
jgi:polyisoprenoid-binding protein YceI